MSKSKNINNELKIQYPDYERALLQTYMTVPEWRYVEMSEEFGQFLMEGQPFYRFPFFKQIITFWQVFKNAYSESNKYHSHRTLLSSEYMVMNVFIGTLTTVGFATLGFISLFLWPFMKAHNQTPVQKHVAGIVNSYAQFLHTIPFYHFDYLRHLKPLWRVFRDNKGTTFADVITLIVTSIFLVSNAALSAPIAWWYTQPQNKPADKIHLLVKSASPTLPQTPHAENMHILSQQCIENTTYYTHITVPRYEAFADIMKIYVDQGIKIKNIAGQSRIQFKLQVENAPEEYLQDYHVLYSYQNHLDNKKTVLIDVPTKTFNQTVTSLAQNHITIKLMHDF